MPYLNSSAVKRAEYDQETERMQLWFADDGPYDFCRVPKHIYEGLLRAPSHGRYYTDNIRDRYQCY